MTRDKELRRIMFVFQGERRGRIERIQRAAADRWPAIFEAAGMNPMHFVRPNRPCPLCGGRDRFTFFAKEENGRWFCRHCGSGDGIELVKRFRRLDFLQTLDFLEPLLGLPPVERQAAKAAAAGNTAIDAARQKKLEEQWRVSQPLDWRVDNPVLRYLKRRGLEGCDLSRELRYAPAAPYWSAAEEGEKPVLLGIYPAMYARVSRSDGAIAAIHRTYLTDEGRKAPVPFVKKLTSGKLDDAAVRLFPPSNLLCLTEGIETALSVHELTGLPVWSLISVSGFARFSVPEGIKEIRIYGDNDLSFAGAAGAYELARRLSSTAPGVSVSVRIPSEAGADWNDVLRCGGAAVRR